MKYILIIPLLLSLSLAQSTAPSARMEQDMHVMNEILHELFQSGIDVSGLRFRSNNQEARYQPGFGIILYAPPALQLSRARAGSEPLLVSSPSALATPGTIYGHVSSPDSAEKTIEKNLRFFLQQYGDLAGELQADEKVMVVYDGQSQQNAVTFYRGQVRGALASSGTSYQGLISASAKMEDIRSLRSGKLSPTAFQEKVSFHSEQKEEKNQLEFRVFGKILSERLYEIEKAHRNDFQASEGEFFSFPAAKVDMKVLEGLGVNYDVYWAGKYGSTFTIIAQTPRRSNEASKGKLLLDDSGRKKAVEDAESLVKKFREEVPRIMVSYGRTLRNLEPNELLTVGLIVPSCSDCEEKREVNFSIKAEVLQAYDRNEISLDAAIRKVRLEEEK